MDMEQLKLVIELIAKLGDAGTAAFIWWVVLDKALVPLCWLILLPLTLWLLPKIIFPHMTFHVMLCNIRDMLEIGSKGVLTEAEFREILAKINALQRNQP